MSHAPSVREQVERLLALMRHTTRFYKAGLVLFTIGCVAALAVAVLRPRVYKSEALILYRERIAASAMGREEPGDPARRIATRLRELVLSRSQLEKIINETKLYPDIVEDRGIAEAVELMRTKVGFRSREGDTYSLSFEGINPLQVQRVTQRLTDALVAETRKTFEERDTETLDFLVRESERAEAELKRREEKLSKFVSAYPAFASEAMRTPPGTTPGIGTADPKKVNVAPPRRRSNDPRIEALERALERIEARLNPGPPPAPSLPPEAKELADEWSRKKAEATRELEAAQKDLADKKQSLMDEHPDLKRAKGRVEAAMRRLDDVQLTSMRELARLQGRPQPALQPLSAEERQKLEEERRRLKLDLARYRAEARHSAAGAAEKDQEVNEIVKLETTWVQLMRDVNEAQEQVRQLKARRFTAEIRDRISQQEGGARMVVIDPPYKPTRPVRGGRTQTVAIGAGIALVLAFTLMVFLALIDDRLYSRDDIEVLEIAPLLSAVPVPEPRIRRAERRELKAQDERHRRRQLPRPEKKGQAHG
jgi:hypothetical protein